MPILAKSTSTSFLSADGKLERDVHFVWLN